MKLTDFKLDDKIRCTQWSDKSRWSQIVEIKKDGSIRMMTDDGENHDIPPPGSISYPVGDWDYWTEGNKVMTDDFRLEVWTESDVTDAAIREKFYSQNVTKEGFDLLVLSRKLFAEFAVKIGHLTSFGGRYAAMAMTDRFASYS